VMVGAMRRYRDYNGYLREIFGERVQKIPIDAGLSCPNRDGTISREGCIFCDSRGSGTGAWSEGGLSIREQVLRGRKFAEQRYGARKFIAYFQSFTNTYGPVGLLKGLYDEALDHEGMVGLAVGTRPDCVDREVIELLAHYGKRTLVWIEYGLQSAHNATLSRINRGHDVRAFERAVLESARHGLNVCAHVILGLPGEDREMMMGTARFLGSLPVRGVKIHLLYVVKGTRLASLYEDGACRVLEQGEYIDLVVDFLEYLPSNMVVQRLTGDPPPQDLIAPRWAMNKSENLRLIKRRLEERDTWQGKKCKSSITGSSLGRA